MPTVAPTAVVAPPQFSQWSRRAILSMAEEDSIASMLGADADEPSAADEKPKKKGGDPPPKKEKEKEREKERRRRGGGGRR